MDLSFKWFPASGLLPVAVLFILTASAASAATLNVSGGQLLGASGVIVDGSSYDVEFFEGQCITVFDGCNAVSDFTFQTEAAALLASQALLDQVFLDGTYLFDTDPELTAGCILTSYCFAYTPYGVVGVDVLSARSLNYPTSDAIGIYGGLDTTDIMSSFAGGTYVVWTPVPVPEPGTALLIGLGLLGLSVRNRRES